MQIARGTKHDRRRGVGQCVVCWGQFIVGLAVGPKRGPAVLLKIQTVSEDNFSRRQGLGYAGFGRERVQLEDGMINELDEYELRHFLERKGVQVPARSWERALLLRWC